MKPLSPKDPKEIGGFTLVGRLGAGGMGVVYLASRKSDSVALKVIRESLIDDEVEATRFTREVVTLEKIQSPHVARILETGIDDGRAWFAVEFVNGPNLSELVQDKGPLDESRWWELAHGLLRGLSDVHDAGVLHRDIKPANVIMAESGPKLIDFGIAHVSDATSVTATGLVAGSPAWFSPEQIEGLELTTATDVFSAGSLLIFAATGSSPWGGATTMTKASVFKILTSEPDLSGLSPAQVSLVSVMLDKEASQRPAAESLSENIDAIRAGKKVELRRAGAAPKPKGTEATTTVERASLNPPGRAAYQADAGKLVAGRQGVSASSSGAGNTKRNWTAVNTAMAVILSLGVLFVGLIAGGNEADEACRSEQENTIEVQARRYQGLWDAYEASLERANLGSTDGQSLPYTTWAARSGDLVSFMQSDLQTAQYVLTLDPAAQNYVERIVDAQVELTNAWVDFRSASQRQSPTAFDDATQGVYEAEDGLERAVSVSPSDFAAAACLESVQ